MQSAGVPSACSSRKLCSAIQAVEVSLPAQDTGPPIRALIPRQVFERFFLTDAQPASWLRAYDQHAVVLDAMIRRRYAVHPTDPVVLRRFDPH